MKLLRNQMACRGVGTTHVRKLTAVSKLGSWIHLRSFPPWMCHGVFFTATAQSPDHRTEATSSPQSGALR